MAERRYKIIISNKNIYKEIELAPNLQELKVGTGSDCEIRLRKDIFFEAIEFTLLRNDERWSVVCADNIYLSTGDVRKLFTKELEHGDDLIVRYQNSDNFVFNLMFVLDFEYEEKAYDLMIDISSISKVKIGGTNDCQIYIKSIFVGNDNLEIEQSNGEFFLKRDTTQYGIYLNGKKNSTEAKLEENDFISIADFSFCLKSGKLYTSKKEYLEIRGLKAFTVTNSKSHHKYPKFNRSTRIKSILPTEKIEILDPPAAPQKPSGNIIMKLLPALAMLALTIVMRGIMSNSGGAYVWMSVCTMSLGIITSVVGIVNDRKKYKANVVERENKYGQYIENKEGEIRECRKMEAKLLEDTFYSVDKEIGLVEEFSPHLFNREVDDDDYLEIRLGTGRSKAIREIEYKKQETFEAMDEMANIPINIAEKYKFIDKTPITIGLKYINAMGIVGERYYLYGLLKTIILDLAIRHYYTDLKMFLIIDETRSEQFRWIRLLPHLQNEQMGIRNIVCDVDSKNLLFEYLYKELSRRDAEDNVNQDIVIFVYDDVGLKRHPISRYIDKAASLRVHFIFFDEYEEFLPNGCSSIVHLENHEQGKVVLASDYTQERTFTYTTIKDGVAAKVVNKLSPVYCEEVSLEGSLTKNITLFELLNILSVEDIDLEKNWANSMVYKSMAAPLGVKAKNQVVCLDLNEKHHGPHGLVAGTTGSGKSEIIQTYILSMATIFHPYEVGFVIIDFKGGGMVNQFKNLPHLIGAITNIDGREINRSLLSIKAELKKRQALFAEYGVNHIDSYIKLFRQGKTQIPLPHLILIVDEFAELKMDQPEFMKELISAARIGRSLGVHLILATQKPSGVVDAQIWSNSKFKLCLKVQNKEDSNEVLKTPLAAEIKEPGRAYLQVGNNEIFDLFQSAYSGAPSNVDDTKSQKSFVINQLELSGKRTVVYSKQKQKSDDNAETQLNAIVEYVAAYCRNHNIMSLPGICLPPLRDMINYSEATNTYDSINTIIPLGIYDDPDNQLQKEVTLNISEGNTVIIGSSQYGKTNLLQTIIRGLSSLYKPSEINMYILDFGSMALKVFDELNHVGGVVVATDDEKMKNFIRLIRTEMKVRKEIFSKIGITSFSSYKEAGNTDMPHIVIMVDNFIALKELYSEYEEDILNICREGVAVGITLIITAMQTNGISYKYMSNFSNRICMYCNQRDEYGTVLDRCRMEPKNVPGRGLLTINKLIYEYQTYLAFEGTKEIERVNKIKEFVVETNLKTGKVKAKRIPEVPQNLDMDYIKENAMQLLENGLKVPTGIDYDTVEFCTVDLLKANTIGITGKEKFGKTNLVKLIVSYLQRQVFDIASKVYIIDDYEKQLQGISTYGIVEKYSVNLSEFEEILLEIEEELKQRLQMVQDAGIEVIDNEPLILFIIQNNEIYSPDGISKATVEMYKRILKNYHNMKICFLFANIENTSIAYGATEMLKAVKEYKYLFAMEDLSNLKLIDINANTLRKFKKPVERGDAYLITDKGIEKQKIIHMKEE